LPSSSDFDEKMRFADYYRDHFIPEHQHPVNIGLHVIGAISAVALVIASVTVIPIWWALMFPIVQGLPGLIGHRFFERDADFGDLRFTRTDAPFYWATLAGFVMAARVLVGRR
jgi:hypothetical protein